MEETPLTLEQVEHIPTIPRELSSVRIREFDESTANPEPIVQDDEADHLLEEFLSPAKLVSVWWITTVFLRTWTPSVICLSQLWGLRGGRYVHSLNFKSSCFACWGGSHVPVSILLLFAIFSCHRCSVNLSSCRLLPFHLSYVTVSRPYHPLEFYLKRPQLPPQVIDVKYGCFSFFGNFADSYHLFSYKKHFAD